MLINGHPCVFVFQLGECQSLLEAVLVQSVYDVFAPGRDAL